MEILTLKTFKEVRKETGTWNAVLTMLCHAGLQDELIEHLMDGFAVELGPRNAEKIKTKDLYDFLDGALLAVQEWNPTFYSHSSN